MMEMNSQTDNLLQVLDNWREKHITVAGDFMLDRYTYGDIERFAPDAPIPVLSNQSTDSNPGGASNVVKSLRSLGCAVDMLGVIGHDDAGDELYKSLLLTGTNDSGLIRTNNRRTTVKHNYVGYAQHRHMQKMFRTDTEDTFDIGYDLCCRILSKAKEIIPITDLLCLEDYNKGVLIEEVCQDLIKMAQYYDVPVFVDPASIDDFDKYRGATCITPNRTEALKVSKSLSFDKNLAKDISHKYKIDTVLITLDKEGSYLYNKGSEPTEIPTVAKSIYDVTGAGDQVFAMLAASYANCKDWKKSSYLANIAAGLEVEQFGIVPITLSQVLLELLEQKDSFARKQRTLEEAKFEFDTYRDQGKRIVFTNGCFDILHAGHIKFLREARKLGDILVVGVNSDESISRIKGSDRPVNEQSDRLFVLSELESIDYLIVFDDDDPMYLISHIKPHVLCKSDEYEKHEVVGADFVEQQGGSVSLVETFEGKSTTDIIDKLRSSN